MGRGSLVSIVSGYALDHRAIGVRSPAGAKNFSCNLCVQTGSGTHPASCPMGTGGPFVGVKRGPLSSSEVKKRIGAVSPLSQAPSRHEVEQIFVKLSSRCCEREMYRPVVWPIDKRNLKSYWKQF
jgi:hypothetical protein